MILECPSCHARFTVPDQAIPVEGRGVRCSKCSHQWHALAADAVDPNAPPRPAPQPETTVPMDDDAFEKLAAALAEPEIVEKPMRSGAASRKVKSGKRINFNISHKPFMFATPALAAVWLVLAYFAYSPSWSKTPVLSGIYEAFGNTVVDGLAFDDISMERAQEGSKTRFILSGSIRNNSSETRTVPTVRVQLKNREGKNLWEREYPVNTELKGGDVYPFRITNVETAFAKSITRIHVDMGNAIQLTVR